MRGASPIVQYEKFVEFLKKDVGAMLAREAHLAIHYFCDNAGKLLGIQPNTTKQRALSIIKSTAWDIYLLRMPEIMFQENPTQVCVPYVATQEVQLQALANLFSVERIECFSASGITPVVGFDTSGIPEEINKLIDDELEPQSRSGNIEVPVGLHEAMIRQLMMVCA